MADNRQAGKPESGAHLFLRNTLPRHPAPRMIVCSIEGLGLRDHITSSSPQHYCSGDETLTWETYSNHSTVLLNQSWASFLFCEGHEIPSLAYPEAVEHRARVQTQSVQSPRALCVEASGRWWNIHPNMELRRMPKYPTTK